MAGILTPPDEALNVFQKDILAMLLVAMAIPGKKLRLAIQTAVSGIPVTELGFAPINWTLPSNAPKWAGVVSWWLMGTSAW